MTNYFSPRAFAAFVDSLVDAGVQIPDVVHNARRIHEAVEDDTIHELATRRGTANPDMSLEDMAAVARDAALTQTISETHVRETIVELDTATSLNAAGILHAGADELLDQLRPAFKKSAAVFTKAVKAGLTPGLKAANVIDMGDATIRLWRSLDEHAHTLEQIANIRLSMCELLGVAPHEHTGGTRQVRYLGAAFRTDAPPWRIHEYDSGVNRWLRLSTQPLELLTIAQSTAADDALRGTISEPAFPPGSAGWGADADN